MLALNIILFIHLMLRISNAVEQPLKKAHILAAIYTVPLATINSAHLVLVQSFHKITPRSNF